MIVRRRLDSEKTYCRLQFGTPGAPIFGLKKLASNSWRWLGLPISARFVPSSEPILAFLPVCQLRGGSRHEHNAVV